MIDWKSAAGHPAILKLQEPHFRNCRALGKTAALTQVALHALTPHTTTSNHIPTRASRLKSVGPPTHCSSFDQPHHRHYSDVVNGRPLPTPQLVPSVPMARSRTHRSVAGVALLLCLLAGHAATSCEYNSHKVLLRYMRALQCV